MNIQYEYRIIFSFESEYEDKRNEYLYFVEFQRKKFVQRYNANWFNTKHACRYNQCLH